jgi:hypothetical protein
MTPHKCLDLGGHCCGKLFSAALTVTARLQAPVFGSSFGTQGGFAAFKGVTPPAQNGDAEGEGGEDAEEECKAEFTPLVQLEEVETNTGEENEECILELCAHLRSGPMPRVLSTHPRMH